MSANTTKKKEEEEQDAVAPDGNSQIVSGITAWEKVVGFTFGAIFIMVLLAFALFFPDPTPSQYATFKTVLALASAGVGGILAGFLHVEGTFPKLSVRAGGALALFILVYFFTPKQPAPLPAAEKPSSGDTTTQQTQGGPAVSHTKGDVTITINGAANEKKP